MDIMARLLVDGGCVDSAACCTVILGRRRKRAKEEEEEALEGGMKVACSSACPGARRRHGEAWKVLGVDVSSTTGSVAVHRTAWRHGAGKKTLLPLWAGWAGWAALAWAPGKRFCFFFCFSFLTFVFL